MFERNPPWNKVERKSRKCQLTFRFAANLQESQLDEVVMETKTAGPMVA